MDLCLENDLDLKVQVQLQPEGAVIPLAAFVLLHLLLLLLLLLHLLRPRRHGLALAKRVIERPCRPSALPRRTAVALPLWAGERTARRCRGGIGLVAGLVDVNRWALLSGLPPGPVTRGFLYGGALGLIAIVCLIALANGILVTS